MRNYLKFLKETLKKFVRWKILTGFILINIVFSHFISRFSICNAYGLDKTPETMVEYLNILAWPIIWSLGLILAVLPPFIIITGIIFLVFILPLTLLMKKFEQEGIYLFYLFALICTLLINYYLINLLCAGMSV